MSVLSAIQGLSWDLVILACLTIGLAPFAPPHIVEKLEMLFQGKLARPIDWFDLFLHGAPWVVLLLKAGLQVAGRGAAS